MYIKYVDNFNISLAPRERDSILTKQTIKMCDRYNMNGNEPILKKLRKTVLCCVFSLLHSYEARVILRRISN